jgi:hypothetical protein
LVRVIIALAAEYNLELDQMDIMTAYLNGELEEELYMLPLEGVLIEPGHCWCLKRSLYGLKQAGRTWNKTLDRKLRELGFTRLNAEMCLYVHRKDNQVCFLVVYVDDLLLAASSWVFMDNMKEILLTAFKMKDLSEAKYILGLELQRNRKEGKISLSQKQYICTVLEQTGMSESKPIWTPLAHNTKLMSQTPDANGDNPVILEMSIGGMKVSYLTIIGSLMYAMLGTRPDLAFTVGLLS